MARYLCRKDGYDLTALVLAAAKDKGMNRVNVAPVIEGMAPEEDFEAGVSYLQQNQAMFLDSDEFERLRVICPKDDVANTFVVEV